MGGGQRHDGGRTGLLEPLAEHGVGLDVGQHDEAQLDELLGGAQRLDGVGQQVFGVGVNLQLDEVRAEGLAGQLGGQNGLLGVAHARGVGQQLDARTAYVGEHVVLGVVHVDAFHGYGDHFGLRSLDGAGHQLVGAELARADEQTRTERPSADYQFVFHIAD